jgi:hypothetical protein
VSQNKDHANNDQYQVFTYANLAEMNLQTTYLIPGVLAEAEHCILGGPKKTLKTSIACDLAISLSTATPFLGHWYVPAKARTVLMSGECGLAIIARYMERVVRARGIPPDLFDDWEVTKDIPLFGRADHARAMERFIKDRGAKCVIIDPSFLAMPGADAANLLAMGPMLKSIGDVFVDCGSTLVLIHHTQKRMTPGRLLDLDDLTWAGFSEWAAQWILVNRRVPYVHGTHAHELIGVAGGRAGHDCMWRLSIDESGTAWKTTVDQVKENIPSAEEYADRVYDAVKTSRGGITRNKIREDCKLNDQRTTAALKLLYDCGRIDHGTQRRRGKNVVVYVAV